MKDQEIELTYATRDDEDRLDDDPAYLEWLDSLRHEERETDQLDDFEAPF